MKDAKFTQTKALPAAGATNYSGSIDLNVATTFPNEWRLAYVEVAVPALPSLADAKTLVLTLQDSADNSTFATAGTPLALTLTFTGAGGAGSAGATVKVPLPPTVRRYVRFSQVVASSGGDNTAVSVVYDLVV